MNLTNFNFNQYEIRVVSDDDGKLWFIASDITKVLGYSNGRDAISNHCKPDGVAKRDIGVQTGLKKNGQPSIQQMELSVIDEPNLYRLIIKSPKPEAEPFERWVMEEVLPSIRKHGGYLTIEKTQELIENPDLIIELAMKLKEERERVKALAAQNQKMQAKSDFVDRIIDNDDKIDIGQAAKVLALPFGRNTLFQKLREKGVFFKGKNEPKQEYIDRGYFELKEKFIERNNHPGFVALKVLVTQKGLAYIHKLFPTEKPATQLARIQ